jgi:hypothetical protein
MNTPSLIVVTATAAVVLSALAIFGSYNLRVRSPFLDLDLSPAPFSVPARERPELAK